MDENWPEALATEEACERHSKARNVGSYTLNADGSFGHWSANTISQSVRPHIWYFAVSDCDRQLPNGTHLIEWEMEALQDGGSHFSVEMKWMPAVNIFNLLIFTFFMGVFYQRSRTFVNSAGYLHPVIWLLFAGMMLQYMARCLHTVHLLQYSANGVGTKAFETLGEIFLMLSQVCQTSLLVLIALGYTLLRSKLDKSEVAVQLCCGMAAVHVALVAVGKLQDDAHYKYHEHEGAVGWILLILRVALYAWFLSACRATAALGGGRLQHFMTSFVAAGSLYFLAFPAIFTVFKLFAPYLQHGLMTVGLMAMQMASNVWLSALFLTRGEYFKVSTLSDSCLPGGLKIGMAKLD